MNVNAAVMMRARQCAIKAVKEQFRGQGLKPQHFAHRKIVLAAHDYLSNHPELIAEAKETVDRWLEQGVFGKRAQRAHSVTGKSLFSGQSTSIGDIKC